jgi:hypothetical protein
MLKLLRLPFFPGLANGFTPLSPHALFVAEFAPRRREDGARSNRLRIGACQMACTPLSLQF